jgi:membrane-associated phospholipid phosphatase
MRALDRRPWKRACAWLAFLAPFFVLTYGGANALAVQRHAIPSIAFAWERHIPFIPWTIVPYWSLDFFYGLSVFVCATRSELDAHGRRLLTAQLLAVACFVVFPLKFAFVRPVSQGVAGLMFRMLMRFDRPFNEAPSLHIALLVILWTLYAKHVGPRARWLLHFWFGLIGVSVLTTYQHHFFDVPTGAMLGGMCVWLCPDTRASGRAAEIVGHGDFGSEVQSLGRS